MGRSGPREQQVDPYRQMPRPAETCEVAGLINRENMSEITWPGICSTEEDLVVKMEHKVAQVGITLQRANLSLGSITRLSGWLCTGLQVEHCVQL